MKTQSASEMRNTARRWSVRTQCVLQILIPGEEYISAALWKAQITWSVWLISTLPEGQQRQTYTTSRVSFKGKTATWGRTECGGDARILALRLSDAEFWVIFLRKGCILWNFACPAVKDARQIRQGVLRMHGQDIRDILSRIIQHVTPRNERPNGQFNKFGAGPTPKSPPPIIKSYNRSDQLPSKLQKYLYTVHMPKSLHLPLTGNNHRLPGKNLDQVTQLESPENVCFPLKSISQHNFNCSNPAFSFEAQILESKFPLLY
jgi:hypothetical protein